MLNGVGLDGCHENPSENSKEIPYRVFTIVPSGLHRNLPT